MAYTYDPGRAWNMPRVGMYPFPEQSYNLGQMPGLQQYGMGGITPLQKPGTGQITFPTPTEAYGWASSLPGMQAQERMLTQMSSPQGMQMSLQPWINQVLQTLGRSGLGSSSYADRMVAETLGNVWAQNRLGTVGGWQNYMGSMAPWAQGSFELPYRTAGLIAGR